MHLDLDQRSIHLSAGEFADFVLGPRDASDGGASGLWRAQLGQHWHNELRTQTAALHPAARFEIPLSHTRLHDGWVFHFNGRIDQAYRENGTLVLREIKSVPGPLPAEISELQADYRTYFIQAITYLALIRDAGGRLPGDESVASPTALRGELVFVEAGSGITQTVALNQVDELVFTTQLERVTEFLNLRLRARERLRSLRFQPAFSALREGQETIQEELEAAFSNRHNTAGVILFEAPTGYGKTGVLLEFALKQMRAGRFERLIYLTGKSTGQLQVMRTLDSMCTIRGKTDSTDTAPSTISVASWQMRPKSEHCINDSFHCSRRTCAYLDALEERWKNSGLSRVYLLENHPRDMDTLRVAGRDARICPYEITRAALPFNDVWVGDYNYVFSPSASGFFTERPGYDPANTLLIVDEAHNLPTRVADAHSHAVTASDTLALLSEFYRIRPPGTLILAWENWAHLLNGLNHCESLPPDLEADVRDALAHLSSLITATPIDHEQLNPKLAEVYWNTPRLLEFLDNPDLVKHLWVPRQGELHFVCLDASLVTGKLLRTFGGAILASATLQPADPFIDSCGLDRTAPDIEKAAPIDPALELGKVPRRARKVLKGVTTAAELLRVEEESDASRPRLLPARAPWRDHAYMIGLDVRVDTTFQHRSHHFPMTAATVVKLRAASPGAAVAVFFPSYAYAESIREALANTAPALRVATQPRQGDLAALSQWVEESLATADALFLVLGSSFAEGIDVLGGRISHAMVVGPALPEVNALQRARMAGFERKGLRRDSAFRRVYQIPGMQKVNQALGRLVRAPGQRAKVILHCQRFANSDYHSLLASEYRHGDRIASDQGLAEWLGQ